MIPTSVLQALAELVELAIQVAPHIADAIKANGELSDAQKADLIARVTSTRAAVIADRPEAVPMLPEPPPTAPGR